MKIIITEEQKKKLFIPRKLSGEGSRWEQWNKEQPIINGERINQYDPEGNKQGYWEYYHPNGKLLSKGNYINNKKEGNWESYWNNGDLGSKGSFINGYQDGVWEWYYSNGNLMSKELYDDGKFVKYISPLTESKKLFIPRKLSDNDSRYSDWNNSQPIKDGKRINQYDGEGRKQGYWEHNANDDEYKRSGSYINDKKEGVWEWFWDNDQLWHKGLFVNDKMEGIWEFYNENGKLFNKKLFKNGIWKDIPITESEEPKKKLFIPRKLSGEDNRYTEWNTQQPTITLDIHTFKLNQYDQNGNQIGIWLDKPERINQNYIKTKPFMENLFNNLNVFKRDRFTNYKLNNKIH